MDLPFKFELPRLSHLHFLQLLLPFIPGTVVMVCLTLGNSPLTQGLWAIGLGYKTIVALAVVVTYIIGLATMTITETANSVVSRRIRRPQRSSPWTNSYWRRIAASYVGVGLSPDTATFSSPEELDRLNKFIIGLSNKEVEQIGLGARRASLLNLQKALEKLTEHIAKAAIRPENPEVAALLREAKNVATESTETLKEQTRVLEETERQLRAFGVDFEWIALHHALQFRQFSQVVHPYGGFSLLMTALQAAGVAAFWLMIQFRTWTFTGVFVAVALIVATTYASWINLKMDEFYRSLNSAELSGMIQELMQRKTVSSN